MSIRPRFDFPEEGPVTIGSQVDAAFRLFDQLPFGVRQDLARLIYLYMHDPGGYLDKRRELFAAVPADGSVTPLRTLWTTADVERTNIPKCSYGGTGNPDRCVLPEGHPDQHLRKDDL